MSEPLPSTSVNGKRKIDEIIILDDDDSNHNRDANEPVPKKQRIAQIDLKEYECPICLELPNGKIFQCNNGHLICDVCCQKLPHSQCPICKIRMNKIRNIIAEKALSLRIVDCTNNNCSKQMPFAQLKQHVNECEYSMTKCKYNELGCVWNGFKKDKNDHENECKIDLDSILKIVNNLNRDMRKKQEKYDIIEKAQNMEIIGIDFSVFNVEQKVTILDSNRFKGWGFDWGVQMKIKQIGQWYTIRIRLICINPENMLFERKFKIYVMFNEIDGRNYFQDIQFKTKISRNKTKSLWITVKPESIFKARMEEIIFTQYYIDFKMFLHECTDYNEINIAPLSI